MLLCDQAQHFLDAEAQSFAISNCYLSWTARTKLGEAVQIDEKPAVDVKIWPRQATGRIIYLCRFRASN